MTDYENENGQIDKGTQDWIEQNPWFKNDPVLQAAAVGADFELANQGVSNPAVRRRLVEREVKERYSDRFQEEDLQMKPTWHDIDDVSERKAAREALRDWNRDMKVMGKPAMTEEQYLKAYFENKGS